jgi:hypothetical protein
MATIPENIETITTVLLKLEKLADSRPPNVKRTMYAYCNAIRIAALNCRRRPQHRGPVRSDPMTPAKTKLIHNLRQAHPDWSLQEIAVAANVNLARVSVALYGKRK